MALDPDWKNLAENTDEFERRSGWSRSAANTSFIKIGAAACVLLLFLYFVARMFESFGQDNWSLAFVFLFAAVSIVIFVRLLFALFRYGLIMAILGWFLYKVGSCAVTGMQDKIERETRTTGASVQPLQPAAPEPKPKPEPKPEENQNSDLGADGFPKLVLDPLPDKLPPRNQLSNGNTVDDLIVDQQDVPPGYKIIACEDMSGKKADCLVKDPDAGQVKVDRTGHNTYL
jgi:hypothetical protein